MQLTVDKTAQEPLHSEVREVFPEDCLLVYEAMLALREGRPVMPSAETFAEWVNATARAEGYRLVASFVSDREGAVAVAGFRFLHTLAWGRLMYVDDLVTLSEFRGEGHGHRLIEWLRAEALRLGCEELHLDSGHHRHDAHRFYLNHGLSITCHHFSQSLRLAESI